MHPWNKLKPFALYVFMFNFKVHPNLYSGKILHHEIGFIDVTKGNLVINKIFLQKDTTSAYFIPG